MRIFLLHMQSLAAKARGKSLLSKILLTTPHPGLLPEGEGATGVFRSESERLLQHRYHFVEFLDDLGDDVFGLSSEVVCHTCFSGIGIQAFELGTGTGNGKAVNVE